MTYALPAQIPYQRYQFTGFGAAPALFNAAATWNDWLAGAPTPTSDGNNAAGMRAADAIRTALTQAGYGPFNMGVSWGTSADKAGMGKFVNDNQIAPSSNGAWWPTKQALVALESAPGVNTAGMSGAKIGLLILGAVALGALAYRAKKKDTGGYSAYTSNRRRRRYMANVSHHGGHRKQSGRKRPDEQRIYEVSTDRGDVEFTSKRAADAYAAKQRRRGERDVTVSMFLRGPVRA